MTHTDLKQTRQELGLTQRKMAEALHTPFRTYQDWEAGRSRIPGVLEIALRVLIQTSTMRRRMEMEKKGLNYLVELGTTRNGKFVNCCRCGSQTIYEDAKTAKAEYSKDSHCRSCGANAARWRFDEEKEPRTPA